VAVRDYVARFLTDLTGWKVDAAVDDTRDLERQTDRTADSVARDWRRMADAGDRAARDLRTSTDRIGRDVRSELGSTGKEAGAEFASNLGESLASGDASRIAQDSVGGLVASLAFAGPIGAAVAAGGTIGLTLWNSFEEKTKAQREAVLAASGSIYQGLIEQGAAFAEQYGADTLREFFDPSVVDGLAPAARRAGTRLRMDLGAALAGGPDSIAEAARTARDRLDDLDARLRTATRSGRIPLVDEAAALRDVLTYLESITTGWAEAETAANNYARAQSRIYRQAPTLRPGSRDAGQVPRYTTARRGD
jgi:hypothetical protein